MCFFTSLSVNAAAVAKRYGKQLDIIEAARQILAEQNRKNGPNRNETQSTKSVSSIFTWPKTSMSSLPMPSRIA